MYLTFFFKVTWVAKDTRNSSTDQSYSREFSVQVKRDFYPFRAKQFDLFVQPNLLIDTFFKTLHTLFPKFDTKLHNIVHLGKATTFSLLMFTKLMYDFFFLLLIASFQIRWTW